MAYETILVEQRGAVTLMTINRPQALNALNSQVLRDLIEAFAAYDADPTQHCAVLTGNEKAFAAGADIKEMSEKDAADFFLEDFFSGWTSRVTATRKPWIAAVARSEEHTSELQSLMRISYAVFCLKKKTTHTYITYNNNKIQHSKPTH